MASRSRARPRRRQSPDNLLYALFVVAPWWVCPLVAAAVGFGVLRLCQQALHWSASSAGNVAVWAVALVLLTGLCAWGEKWARRRRLRGTRSLDQLRSLSWQEFEALIADAYRGYGWSVRETGALNGGGPDGGVDLVMQRFGEVVAVQCKRWRMRDVGVDTARELAGSLADCRASRGILVTCGRFTRAASEYAARNGLQLVDGTAVLALLPDATPAPAARVSRAAPRPMSCPHCHGEMVQRRSRLGLFWGCRQYPQCRGTRPWAVNG